MSNSVGFTFQSEILYVESPGRKRNHAVAEIPGKRRIRGVLSLVAASGRSTAPLRIEFLTIGATPPIAAVQQWYPMDKEVIEREERARQVLVTARLIGGAMWLDDGTGTDILEINNSDRSRSAHTRIQRGYHNGVAVEGEIAGARTGTAQFDDLSWQGAQGDVARTATLGRVLGGVAMRFGHDVILAGRAGIGFHGASFHSEFSPVAGRNETGPGDGFEFDMLLYGGLGVDIRLGKSWSLGATIDGGQDLDGARFVHAGLQFGYGWNP